MTERYAVVQGVTGVRVIDTVLADSIVSLHPTWSQAYSAAAALNNPRPAPTAEHIDRHLLPAAPCCDCAERAERYRHVLARISRFSDDRDYAATLAIEALAGGEMVSKEFDLVEHLYRQRTFSLETFGPGKRTFGVIAHIRKELREIANAPTDLKEWVDVILLAFDGAWRAGHEPEQIADGIAAKQIKNEARAWPDWRTADPNGPIEHTRGEGPDAS